MSAKLNLKPETLEKIKQGRESGLSFQEIADKVPPLTKNQVRNAIHRYRWKPLKKSAIPTGYTAEETNELVLSNLQHIQRTVKWLFRKNILVRLVLGSEEDALQQAVLYCLQQGIRLYNGFVSLNVYFRRLAFCGLMEHIKPDLRKKRLVYNENAPEVFYYECEGISKGNHIVELLDRLEVQQYLKILSEEQRQAITLVYGLSGHKVETKRDISKKLGISEFALYRIISCAIKELKNCFAKSS